MESLESLVPYLPFIIVVVWGFYRMFARLIMRIFSSKATESDSES